MERRISHRLSGVPSSVISQSTTQDSRADTPGGDPPVIDPPVVGKVTHYSIELIWDVKNILMNDDTPEESVTFSIEEEDSHTHTYGTVFTGVTKHHVVEGLEPNTPYKFRLKVSYANGDYAYSSVVSVSTTRGHFIADHLQRAVNLNDSKAVRRILQEGAVYVDVLDNLGFTPLMTASQEGFTKIVALLVEHGADVRKVNGSGKDSLMLACHSGHLDVVQYLLSKGASWKKRDKAGCVALHYAVDGGHLNVIDWLIKSGCRVDERDGVLEWTSLMRVSAITGNAEVASFLIKSGADVNARDADGKTPLMVATLNNHERLAKVLLEKGADPLLANEYGRTIIDMAKALHKPHMVTLLETFAKT